MPAGQLPRLRGMRLKVRRSTLVACRFTTIIVLLAACGCGKPTRPIDIDTEYASVFLDNGQVFVGKLKEADSSYILLSDVFHIKSWVVQDPDKNREIKNTFSIRSSEAHGPAITYINTQHILLIEPVAVNSSISDLIKKAKAEKNAQGR